MKEDDFWEKLRQSSLARIGLTRSGNSISTDEHLNFRQAHAMAKDAVYSSLNIHKIRNDLLEFVPEVLVLKTKAENRPKYLKRPDLGKKLNDSSRNTVKATKKTFDITFVIADGLSSEAVDTNILPCFKNVYQYFSKSYSIAPVCIVEQGRVAIGDDIAAEFNSKLVVVFLGERPGLSSMASMGIYFTYKPFRGISDAQRNCISNVRPEGLPSELAADKLNYLLTESLQKRISGVALKDNWNPGIVLPY